MSIPIGEKLRKIRDVLIHARKTVVCAICASTLVLAGCAVQNLPGGAPESAQIDYPGEIILPKTFVSVWYRPGKSSFSPVAFSASGTLVVGEDAIDFRAGDNSMSIPVSSIQSIAWGKVGADFVNDWAIVRFDDGGQSTEVSFKDGSSLGHGEDSDLIYAAIKYAAVVRGGVRPNPESFHSGWVVAHGGGVIARDRKPSLVYYFSNKAPVPIWVSVTFSTPSPAYDCKITSSLAAGEKKEFLCPQDQMYADSLYSIHIDTYLDEVRTNMADRNIVTHRFSQAEVAAAAAFLTTEVPGTLADSELQAAITERLFSEESKLHGDCQHDVLRAEVYGEDDQSIITAKMGSKAQEVEGRLRAKGDMLVEKWIVKSCDNISAYEVLLTKAPGGGTDIIVQKTK